MRGSIGLTSTPLYFSMEFCLRGVSHRSGLDTLMHCDPQLLKGFKSPGVTTPYMYQAGLLEY
jgi:hypothetical protein